MIHKLREFGYSRHTIIPRLVLRHSLPKPLLANAIPKSGTNLLLRLLILLPFYSRMLSKTVTENNANRVIKVKAGKFLMGHVKYTRDLDSIITNKNIKNILMVRNPLDVALSNVRYISTQDKKHRLHNYYANVLTTDVDRFCASLCGISSSDLDGLERSKSISEHYDDYSGWLNSQGTLIIKYEDLVGAKGGGDDIAQRKCIESVANYLELQYTSESLDRIQAELFSSKSRTFYKGRINRGSDFIREHSLTHLIDNDLRETMLKYDYII